jgi:hypothetical protein
MNNLQMVAARRPMPCGSPCWPYSCVPDYRSRSDRPSRQRPAELAKSSGSFAAAECSAQPIRQRLPCSFHLRRPIVARKPLDGWQRTRVDTRLPTETAVYATDQVTYTDPQTGLAIALRGRRIRGFPDALSGRSPSATRATSETPILEDVRALDIAMAANRRNRVSVAPRSRLAGEPLGLWAAGDRPGSQPVEATSPGQGAGRPMSTGRTSTWSGINQGSDRSPSAGPDSGTAELKRDGGAGPPGCGPGRNLLRSEAVLPGEEIRSPLIVLQFWQGDYLPLAEPLAALDDGPQHAQAGRQTAPAPVRRLQLPGLRGDARGQRAEPDHAHRSLPGGRACKLDYWWMDAGWYIQQARLAPRRNLGGGSRSGSPAVSGPSATTPTPKA